MLFNISARLNQEQFAQSQVGLNLRVDEQKKNQWELSTPSPPQAAFREGPGSKFSEVHRCLK